jgi:hypothetical protein
MNGQCWEGNVKDTSVRNKGAVLNGDEGTQGDSKVCVSFYQSVPCERCVS